MSTYKKLAAVAALVAVLALAGVALGLWWHAKTKQQVSTDESVEIVHDFYSRWLEAAQSTSTDPYREGLADWPLLGDALRARIVAAQGGSDPVLCQTAVPEKISTRRVYEGADKVEILVTARRSTSTEQAIVTLLPLDGGWYIDDIMCSPGEFAPEPEFTFDREGVLSKDASGAWHLVFVEDGQAGHEAPLRLGAQSVCHASDGTTVACSPDLFAEGAKAHVRGQMTEMGVDVTLVELAG
jgi:hypothetical protein